LISPESFYELELGLARKVAVREWLISAILIEINQLGHSRPSLSDFSGRHPLQSRIPPS
jgi:hypothetical protein